MKTIAAHIQANRWFAFGRLLAVSGFLAVFAELRAQTRWETLQAIHWVENPRNSSQPGPHGELGAYQFRPQTWSMHTKIPFSHAVDRGCSDQVAVLHYEWLKTRMERAGVKPTAYNIALAWNAGLGAVLNNRVPSASHNYATRVANLAGELRARQIASAR